MQLELEQESLRSQIALGWALQLVILVTMLLFMTVDSVLADDNFRFLRFDPGRAGLKQIVYLVAIYALMPVYVHLVHGLRPRAFRWAAVVLAVLGFLFLLLHHLAHWQYGQRPDFSSHVLDVVVHLVGIWVIVNSVRWARSRGEATA